MVYLRVSVLYLQDKLLGDLRRRPKLSVTTGVLNAALMAAGGRGLRLLRAARATQVEPNVLSATMAMMQAEQLKGWRSASRCSVWPRAYRCRELYSSRIELDSNMTSLLSYPIACTCFDAGCARVRREDLLRSSQGCDGLESSGPHRDHRLGPYML